MAELTAGTWLTLLHAITESGCRVGLVANRDSARLRKAIAGANKTDVIDADMLARSEAILGVEQAPIPPAGQIGLRRAMRRRRRAIVEAHRVDCRLWALAAWALPDVWRACGGHLRALGRARTASITEIVAAHSRDTTPGRRAERIWAAASGWARFWLGRLDDLAWEIGDCLDDIAAGLEAVCEWEMVYGEGSDTGVPIWPAAHDRRSTSNLRLDNGQQPMAT